MIKLNPKDIKKSPKFMLRIIDNIKNDLKNDSTCIEMFKNKNINIDYIDYIPIYFGPLDVSGKTDKGIITINENLLNKGLEMVKACALHEMEHWLSQSCSKHGTESSENESGKSYLGNKDEEKAFKVQIEYMKDNMGRNKTENYVDNLLDHHDLKGPEKNKKKKELLET